MKVKSESEVAQSCPTLSNPWTAAYQARKWPTIRWLKVTQIYSIIALRVGSLTSLSLGERLGVRRATFSPDAGGETLSP